MLLSNFHRPAFNKRASFVLETFGWKEDELQQPVTVSQAPAAAEGRNEDEQSLTCGFPCVDMFVYRIYNQQGCNVAWEGTAGRN